MNDISKFQPKPKDVIKFVAMSLIGAFLFLVPLPWRGSFNIPLGIAINLLEDYVFPLFSLGIYAPETIAGEFQIHYILALIAITMSFLLTVVAHVFKPGFIMNNEKIKSVFLSSPVYFISKGIAFVIVWMVFLNIGPAYVIASETGDVIIGLVAGLMTIFIILGPVIPILTDFGLMEFIGILIKKVVRVLFTLPGRAAVDLVASILGSSAAAVIITRDQYEKGFYTGREAAVNATNFAMVSLPFTLVIATRLDFVERFGLFYLFVIGISVILAVIMPRIWPLRGIKDTYLEDVGKQIDEEVPSDKGPFKQAFLLACNRAHNTTAANTVKSGLYSYLQIFMDLIPVILAWGTLASMVVIHIPIVFEVLSWPLGQYLQLLRVEYAMEFAYTTLIGFIDMFLPALMLEGAPDATRFILGVLSIVQIIYLAETGALIIKSRIPLGIGKLFAIFMIRTVIALPIIVLFTRLLF
ncbi:MAG: hypothetical protein FWC72_00950 [Oscillospiraceae bacterium]|nr:hypothetical protein [Oscillospiraceae bacterium]